MGWKVAWSDRMVSMYASTWLFGLLWWPLRKRIKFLPVWGLLLFLLPMGIDGTSHLISDLSGLGQGFRDSNAWLAQLTGGNFPITFYAGDAWGSFNAWMWTWIKGEAEAREEWLIIRIELSGERKYTLSNAPADTPLERLAEERDIYEQKTAGRGQKRALVSKSDVSLMTSIRQCC